MKSAKLCALLEVVAFTLGLVVILSVVVIGVTGEGCVRLANQDGVIVETRGCVGEEGS